MSESPYTNVVIEPLPKRHSDLFDDAIASAKFSFVFGGAIGIQTAMQRHRNTAVLLDLAAHPGVPAHIFKTAAGFAAASVGITAIVHLCRAVRNEDDSVNFGIATGVLGAAIGANRRSAKLAILCASVFSVAGGLADYGLRQVMSRGENVHDLHSSIDYRRFEKKSHAGGEH